MAIKILEIDLNEALLPITTSGVYDQYRILVRIRRQPIGWISVSIADSNMITPQQIHQLIQHQIGWQVLQQSLAFYLKDNTTAPPAVEDFISVIVCTRNRAAQLAHCLHSLSLMQYQHYEVIVVDNAPSSDETFQLVRHLNVRYVCEERPGLDWARNRGIEEAKHDIIAFTDDDVCVDRYWLHEIARVFNNPGVMAVTGYVAPAELETPAQNIFELAYGGMGQGFKRRIIKRQHLSEQQLIWASNFGIGANMAFRAQVFCKTGNFDTALDVGTPSCGGGDIEMFYRLVSKGYTLVYEPAVLVWHTHRKNMPALKSQIFNNGRGFGCYLITCAHNRSVKYSSVIKFLLINWFYKWNFKNLLTAKLPRTLTLIELYGMLTSPLAYIKSRAHAKRITNVKTTSIIKGFQK